MRRRQKTPSFNAVAAGQTATLDLPTNRRYHSVMLRTQHTAGSTDVDIDTFASEIRIKVDGRVQRTYTGALIRDLIKIYTNALAPDAGYATVFFSEPWRATPVDEDALGWGMQDVSTFQIEVDIKAGVVSPKIWAIAETDDVQQPLGGIVKISRITVPVTATGVTTITTLPKTDFGYVRLMCAPTSVSDITDIKVSVDSNVMYELSRLEADAHLNFRADSSASPWFLVDFDNTNRVADMLTMRYADGRSISELRVDFNMNAANSFPLFYFTAGPRN